jgi:hypothetical protein
VTCRGRHHDKRKPPLIVRCASGKTGFTEAEAQRRADAYASDPRNRKATIARIYPCPLCGYWHLTSRK